MTYHLANILTQIPDPTEPAHIGLGIGGGIVGGILVALFFLYVNRRQLALPLKRLAVMLEPGTPDNPSPLQQAVTQSIASTQKTALDQWAEFANRFANELKAANVGLAQANENTIKTATEQAKFYQDLFTSLQTRITQVEANAAADRQRFEERLCDKDRIIESLSTELRLVKDEISSLKIKEAGRDHREAQIMQERDNAIEENRRLKQLLEQKEAELAVVTAERDQLKRDKLVLEQLLAGKAETIKSLSEPILDALKPTPQGDEVKEPSHADRDPSTS